MGQKSANSLHTPIEAGRLKNPQSSHSIMTNEAGDNHRIICMECGNLGFRHVMCNKVIVICRICMVTMESSGETDTLLDKY